MNEDSPAGETGEEENENSPLEKHSHLLQVATSEGLLERREEMASQ